MFKHLKDAIKQLAQSAVAIAEKTLGSSTGQLKKKMAIDYVTSKLPVPSFLKSFIAVLLSGFIDDSIEFAVEYMNSLNQKTDGETYE
ncbi:TPA: hypothetical protein IAC10_04850 [Candidatus Scatousia excrementigallinarum]|uniref:Uncharacterized protein n=1 Tax=Candidatus Scatousia excrementigallinarum TaxID=2840935 RepID=A0A9D1JME1_9BACT|nr:hypothetical protein [Candidatus Scatousia excrementigallinarum]